MCDDGEVRVELVVVMLAVAGCDNLFGLTTIDPLADAPGIDGTGTDARDGAVITGDAPPPAGLGCVTPLLVEHFTATTPCSPWGSPYMASNATMSEGSHSLLIQPASQLDSLAGCRSNATYLWTGGVVIVRTKQILTGMGPYTMLQTHGGGDVAIGAGDGTLKFQRTDGSLIWAAAPYQSVAMQWWRLRAVGGMIYAEFSPDGNAWTELGHQMLAVTSISIDVMASSGVSSSPPGVAEFTDLYVCSQ
jgi:hypothetical protein